MADWAHACYIASMAKIVAPELGEELRRLRAELLEAQERAAAALRTNPPGHVLEGAALARFRTEDEKVAAIVRRIKEIQGE